MSEQVNKMLFFFFHKDKRQTYKPIALRGTWQVILHGSTGDYGPNAACTPYIGLGLLLAKESPVGTRLKPFLMPAKFTVTHL